ncbi:peptide chain release factor H [Candidatus Bodocaedibacter vickermanii]|uniref:Peptide chain release factor RF2 n=1 Tax=Candidatus Bodocaedibacter vickermanii TaxID=2741701 RepID=A0A7L9RS19_9PROT|nr:Peptide chain release factor RF2 [Candidatus Paracaedibacteraceae bacterium 'Lake Konstanz']
MSQDTILRWVQITSGQGPAECELAVQHVLDRFLKEALQQHLKVDVLEKIPGEKGNIYQSVLLSVSGDSLIPFLKRWQGTIQWICESPYRPTHKRKNWFIGVNILNALDSHKDINVADLRFETMRASGAGGQHVNTTDSAVRVIHIPTGLTAFAQEERSQHMNKKLALARLSAAFDERSMAARFEKNHEKHSKHYELERGNPTRVFVGQDFKEKVR